jgi:type I thyroxine 5'-deiodinase
MSSNDEEGICYPQPSSLDDRLAIARDFIERSDYDIPMLVDRMDNAADEHYAGWPERLYVIDELGKIAFKGKTGPFGFHPEEIEAWFDALP